MHICAAKNQSDLHNNSHVFFRPCLANEEIVRTHVCQTYQILKCVGHTPTPSSTTPGHVQFYHQRQYQYPSNNLDWADMVPTMEKQIMMNI